jgi:hypothetical protein
MMGAPVTFPNPRRAVRDRLRELLAGRPEPYAAGAVVEVKPATPGGPRPYVQVLSDGKFRDSRLNGRASVRLLVYHRDGGLAEDLAELVESLMLASSGSALIRGASPLAGPRPADDEELGEPFAYLTLTVRLRPTNL